MATVRRSASSRMRQRQEWKFFAVLPRASPRLAALWWLALVLRGVFPSVFTVAMGVLIGEVQQHRSLAPGLTLVGVSFVMLQVLAPFHQALSANLGSRVSACLYDRLTRACVGPPGIGHLESPDLIGDLTVARDFDLGMTGPPMHINVDFIASGLVDLASGFVSALILFAYRWWAPFVLVLAWGATHWLLRESSVWRDRNTDEVRLAQRHSDYTYRLAVDAPAAKELRLFGLAGWTLERFIDRRRQLFDLQYRATRLRERPVIWSLVLVVGANLAVFLSLAADAWGGHLSLGRLVVFAQAAVGAALIAFGGLNWALDGAAAAVAAVLRLEPAMEPAGALAPGPTGGALPAPGLPRRELRFRSVGFSYPRTTQVVLDRLDLVVPAGSSLAIVGQNGAGKTTLAKLLCRLYDPTTGAIEVDGVDLRDLDVDSWRRQVAAVFQDFVRFELPLRENVAPAGATDEVIRAALADAGAEGLADLDTPLSKAYPAGTDLSGGQWQRVALARALCAVRMGARLVLLDEPTAQLDVRGEAAIFERLLEATRDVTTLLISHRFSTVRRADRICVLEHGRVVELGTHAELMALGGRYRTMFDLQARRFEQSEDEEGQVYDVLA
ncbi:MAG TPA: ABC transporter ATP-binding protein [Acidimicrobiales bacterium]|nr:ABC transporter ATP-binding protein [Acidimicrobiales bacterium]